MLGSDVGDWEVRRAFARTEWLGESVEAVTHGLIHQDYALAYHELMRSLDDEKKQGAETYQILKSLEWLERLESLERLIETKQMHNSKITKIVPFTDEELDWLLSSAT